MDIFEELVGQYGASRNCEDILLLYCCSLHNNPSFPILDKLHAYLCSWILEKTEEAQILCFDRLFNPRLAVLMGNATNQPLMVTTITSHSHSHSNFSWITLSKIYCI